MMNRLIILICICLYSFDLSSQCTVHGVDGGDQSINILTGHRLGQTFLPCQSGVVNAVQITFEAFNDNLGVYNFWIGEATGGLLPTIAQTFTVVSALQHTFTINLVTPLPVTAGTTYEFQSYHTTSNLILLRRQSTDDYAGGSRTLNGVPISTDWDFGVMIGVNNAIPTLSQWGLISLGLLFLIVGTLAISRLSVRA